MKFLKYRKIFRPKNVINISYVKKYTDRRRGTTKEYSISKCTMNNLEIKNQSLIFPGNIFLLLKTGEKKFIHSSIEKEILQILNSFAKIWYKSKSFKHKEFLYWNKNNWSFFLFSSSCSLIWVTWIPSRNIYPCT